MQSAKLLYEYTFFCQTGYKMHYKTKLIMPFDPASGTGSVCALQNIGQTQLEGGG
ncbi:hypothetical protein [Desulfonatronum thioautotrophicum]|uniref:hypothetical protein n=1 Tax=Desulfonatronum thioautotrophicum TaxID=617001 RepID=UPI0012946B95|nr:hypothetical protein [Desulfonatronum thioautotrophicum]